MGASAAGLRATRGRLRQTRRAGADQKYLMMPYRITPRKTKKEKIKARTAIIVFQAPYICLLMFCIKKRQTAEIISITMEPDQSKKSVCRFVMYNDNRPPTIRTATPAKPKNTLVKRAMIAFSASELDMRSLYHPPLPSADNDRLLRPSNCCWMRRRGRGGGRTGQAWCGRLFACDAPVFPVAGSLFACNHVQPFIILL